MRDYDDRPEHLRPMSWWMRQAAEILTKRAAETERRESHGAPVSDPHLLRVSRLSREIVAGRDA